MMNTKIKSFDDLRIDATSVFTGHFAPPGSADTCLEIIDEVENNIHQYLSDPDSFMKFVVNRGIEKCMPVIPYFTGGGLILEFRFYDKDKNLLSNRDAGEIINSTDPELEHLKDETFMVIATNTEALKLLQKKPLLKM